MIDDKIDKIIRRISQEFFGTDDAKEFVKFAVYGWATVALVINAEKPPRLVRLDGSVSETETERSEIASADIAALKSLSPPLAG